MFFLISAFYIWGAPLGQDFRRGVFFYVYVLFCAILDAVCVQSALLSDIGRSAPVESDKTSWRGVLHLRLCLRDPRRRLRAVGDAQRNLGDLSVARTCTLNFRPPVPVVSDKNPRGPPAPRGLVRPHPRGLPALRGPSILVQPGLVDRGHHLADSGILLYPKSYKLPTICEGCSCCPWRSWSR